MIALAEEQLALLPTADDVAEYRRRGWWVTPSLLESEQLEEARDAVARFYAGERDAELPVLLRRKLDWRQGDDPAVRLNDHVALVDRRLARFLDDNPLIAASAARLMQTPQVRLFQSSIATKRAGATEGVDFGWHTDRAYWQTCTSFNMLTAWIPLYDCELSSGCMHMIEGSHLWPDTEEVSTLRSANNFLAKDHDAVQAQLEATGMAVETSPVILKAGQVSFHHCLTVHGSRANVSNVDRIALIFPMQPSDNRYTVAPESAPVRSHSNDQLCRALADGSPDYSDPNVCPVLWDDTAGSTSPSVAQRRA